MRRAWYWVRTHVWGLAVGGVVTLAAAEVFWAGQLEWLSMFLLDFKFKHCNRVVADNRVVMIDITDYALEYVHKWPWPRKEHANLINALNELGAQAILMDLVFAEPEPGRIEHPKLDADYEIDHAVEIIGDSGNLVDVVRDAVWDDEEFSRALDSSGNVFIAMFARLYGPQFHPEAIRGLVNEVFDEHPDIAFDDFQREIRRRLGTGLRHVMTAAGRAAERSDPRDLFDLLRIEHRLETAFGESAAELAARFGVDEKRVNVHIATAKRNVARRLVARYRREHPEARWPEPLTAILPDQSVDVINPDHDDLLLAYRAVSSERVVVDPAMTVPDSLAGRLRNTADLTLPLDKLARAADVGLVSFETDEADGVMRRVALAVRSGDRMLKHLGFALACRVLDIDESTIAWEEGGVLTMSNRSGDSRWRIPIDEEGRTLINWHIDPDKPEWRFSFEHVPVARLMGIPRLRKYLADDEARRAFHRDAFARIRYGEAAAGHANYVELVNRRRQLRARNVTDAETAELAGIEAQLNAIDDENIALVIEAADEILGEVASPEDRAALDPEMLRIVELAERHTQTERKIDESIRGKLARIDKVKAQLRPLIQGNICLIGYTATAVADTVNTPVFDEVPGVMAHANVINSMLVDLFPEMPDRWVIVVLTLVTGLAVTGVTVWRDPWVSLVAMFLVVAVLTVIALGSFYVSTYHVDIVGPLIAVFLSWAFVTLYRQLTEQRQKRAFSKSLAQYTSPAIAAQLADQLTRQAGQLDLSPRARTVTCFFSDLKGFTSISERLGASRTRDVLNPYLEAMSGVLIKSNAMINKFMGDGIFAFFNPPIHPVENHARAAFEASLDSFVALERLKDVLATGDLETEVRALSMRIGVNTGEVFVGDYGSSNKLDYTCIGDTVNLSARLEPACKPFGISTMVSQSTLNAAGDGYVVRHLGGLQVVGKKEAVQVYELIGRTGEVDGEVADYAEKYGEAVRRFQSRDWSGALRILSHCRKSRPDDLAVDLLEGNIRSHQTDPPPDDWNQAIELTSK